MKAIRFYLWTSFVVLVLVSTVALLVTNLPPVWAQVGPGEEDLTVTDPIDGLWHIRSVAALAPVPTAAHVAVTLTIAPRPPAPIPPPPAPGAPTFINYPAPDDCTGTQQPPSCIQPSTGSTTAAEHAAGEPSIGVDWNTGKAFIEAGNHTLRVTFDDSVNPATAFWEDKRSPFARLSLDPIMFVDDGHFGGPNRLFSSQLNGATSELSFSDDDGNNWLPTQGSGQPAGVDHQTVGGGPYAFPAPLTPTGYPHGIYYCSQDVVTAFCSRSDDGGVTFGPGIPIYTFAQVNGVDVPIAPGTCGGLHGHVRVSPDGTVYVPNENCFDANSVSRPGAAFAFLGTQTAGDTQSANFQGVWHLYVAFTYDSGLTWTTVDATPADPVQRGCIWNQGGSNPCRNLLDFNDITVDKLGRVLVGYADGCTGSCVTDPTQNASTGPASAQDALATIARQVGGLGLFKTFDGTQIATRTGDIKGHAKLCFGSPAKGVRGDPGCRANN